MDAVFPSRRPSFDRWLRDRKLNYSTCARSLQCSRETLRRYCLPFDDPKRRFPSKALLRKITALSHGDITGHDFLEPLTTRQVEAA